MIRTIQLTVVCVAVLIASAGQVQAGLIIKVTAVGGDLVFSGTGSIDLLSTLGFSSIESWTTEFAFQNSVLNGPFGSFVGVTSPSSFVDFYTIGNVVVSGQGATNEDFTTLTTSVGDTAFANTSTFFPMPVVFFNTGYTSNASLTINATLTGSSFSDIGHVDGDFTRIAWSNGANSDFIQMNFDNTVAAVPEPSSIAMFGIGACLVGISAVRRRGREKQQQATALF